MSLYKFGPDDLFASRIKTYPDYEYFVYATSVFVNKTANISGSYTTPNILNVPNGYVSLYEMNVDRDPSLTNGLIYPFVSASSRRTTFKKYLKYPNVKSSAGVTGSNLQNYIYPAIGTAITASYPLSASLTRKLTRVSTITWVSSSRPNTLLNRTSSALVNAALKYTTLSKHFVFHPTGSFPVLYPTKDIFTGQLYGPNSNAGAFGANSKFLTRDLTKQEVNMIFVPSIIYGSSIKKGSVNLKFYITGSVIGECSDYRQNGELVELTGSTVSNGTGSVVGIVMYDEGIILLTGSTNLETGPSLDIKYNGSPGPNILSSWMYFAAGLNDGITFDSTIKNASFNIGFKGTNYVNTMTMLCHAKKGHLNYSNNPTFRTFSDVQVIPDMTSSHYSFNEVEYPIKNIVSSSYNVIDEKFEKTTYLSKVAIYDKDGNMIAIASMATPVKKTEDLDYTFKFKLDI
tara:strand:- start:901 stop:2274 length:1374 start_codon:yes stop_codon:yes gene_type:complete